jgi:hypothetical protein
MVTVKQYKCFIFDSKRLYGKVVRINYLNFLVLCSISLAHYFSNFFLRAGRESDAGGPGVSPRRQINLSDHGFCPMASAALRWARAGINSAAAVCPAARTLGAPVRLAWLVPIRYPSSLNSKPRRGRKSKLATIRCCSRNALVTATPHHLLAHLELAETGSPRRSRRTALC